MGKEKLAITGAGGFVAKSLRQLAAKEGIKAVCIARSGFAAIRGEEQLVTPSYDEKKIIKKIYGCTAMVHLAGSGRQSAQCDYHESNYMLTKKITGLCKRAGIPRIVYTSGLGANARATTGYFISKYQAEECIRGSGLQHAILRPSYIMGKQDPLTRSIKRQRRRGAITVLGSGRHIMQPIYIKDACQILLQAATTGKFLGKTVDMVGPQKTTMGQLIRRVKKDAAVRRLDAEQAYHMAVRGRAEIALDDLNILVGSYSSSPARLRRISGVRLAGLDHMLEACGLL